MAKVYQAIGTEDVKVARILNAIVWAGGGLVVYAIGARLMPLVAALVATAYYLFVPLGVLVSRSFQPDSLMVLLWLISLFAILVFSERQTWPTLLAAACASSLTLLLRPLPVWTILAAFIALNSRSLWTRLRDAKEWSFVVLTLAPAALYYGCGMFGRDDLRYVEMSFRPHLLLHREFWEGWLRTATSAVAPATLVAGLAGTAFLEPGRARRFLAGLWAGYAAFGLIHTCHIRTHNYYHLQLVVITALGLGFLLATTLPALAPRFDTRYSELPVVLALLVVMFFVREDISSGLRQPRFESREAARQIGEFV